MELSDLIIKTNLSNTTPYGRIGNSVWDTQDQVFVESIPEFEAHAPQESSLNRCFPTAYALINHAIPYKGQGDLNWKLTDNKDSGMKPACNYYLRSNYENQVAIVDAEGKIKYSTSHKNVGIRPCLSLDIPTFLQIKKGLDRIGYWGSEFEICKDSKWSGPLMKLGEFPQSHSCHNMAFYHQKMNYNYCNKEKEEQVRAGDLIPTGKTFMGSYDASTGKFSEGVEYEYNLPWPIKKVRYCYNNRNIGYWFDVEPILWDIENWSDLPKEINPEGNGTAAVIKLRAQKVIISGIPFNINQNYPDANLWANSSLRGYLNGYDLRSIENRNIRNLEYIALCGGNFKDHNFLNEAMGRVKGLIQEINLLNDNKKSRQRQIKQNALKMNLKATEIGKSL